MSNRITYQREDEIGPCDECNDEATRICVACHCQVCDVCSCPICSEAAIASAKGNANE